MSAGRPAPPAPRRATERALWIAIYLVLVAAPVAFVAATPSTEDAGDFLLPVALGFGALAVMALQVVMSSRAAAFTAPFGFARLLRLHRLAGMAAVVLVLVHVATMIGEEGDFAAWLHPLDAPLAGRLGTGALLLLVLLTVAALLRSVLRTRYEVWRGLHVALGLGAIALAFGHVIAISRFSQTTTVRWVALGFVVAALVSAFHLRVGRHFLAVRRPYRLASTRREPDGSLTLELAAVGHRGATFRPGQFAWLKHASAPYALTEHPFSYATSAHAPERPGFTVKPVGDFTAALERLREGDELLVDGPHGEPALVDERDCVLIAGGSGITPAISVLRTAAEEDDPRRLLLVYLVRDPETAALRSELEALGRREGVRVVIVPSRPPAGWDGPGGRVSAELLDTVLPDDRRRWTYFVCGPPGMLEATRAALDELGIGSGSVRFESYQLA